MRPAAIGPLQLCIGVYCVSLGALMLITPHQFLSRSFLPWQAYLPWWGCLFLLAGCLLFGAALMNLRRFALLLVHLFAGCTLLLLACVFALTQTWSGIISYSVLGFGTALAPLMARPFTTERAVEPPPIDLFTLVMGLMAVVLGLAMLIFPHQFRSAIYATIQPYLRIHGAVFLAGGVALMGGQLWVPHRPAWVAVSHIFGGATFLAFLLTAAIPARSLSAIALYGGLGLSIVFLPWLSRVFRRIDPSRLQTRLALALIALSAIPLVLSVAVISEREAYATTQQTLTRERLLARNMARNTSIFVTLHQSGALLLAQQLSGAPQDAAAHQPFLNAFQQAYPNVLSVLSYNAAGELIAHNSESRLPEPLAQTEIFRSVRDTRRLQIAVGLTNLAPTPVFTIGAPLIRADDTFDGMVIVMLDSAQIAQMWLDSTQIAAGEIYMVNAEGQVIVSPDAELVAGITDRASAPPVAAALSERQVGSMIYTAATGPRLSSYAPVAELGWYVIVDRQADTILRGLRIGQELTVGILLIVIIVAALMSVWLARTLSIPLTMLTNATRTIVEDTAEAATPLPQSSVYEVATLAAQFAELRNSLQQRTAERNRAEQRLQLLADAGSALASSLDTEQTLTQITHLMVPALGDWGLIYLVDGDGTVRLAAATHRDPICRELTETLYTRYPIDPNAAHGVANVLRTGKPEVVTQITDEMLALAARDAEHLRLLKQIGFRAVMVVPMNARGRTLGALVLASADSEQHYDTEDLALAEDLAYRAGLAATNAALYSAERGTRQEAESARAEAETALGARDQFLSIAAHELRTPLTALLGQAQLLERRLKKYPDLTDRDRRALGVITGQAERLDQLIATLFDLNRLQTGQITLHCAPCDLGELVVRLAEELRPTLSIHTFELDLPADPVIIACDQLRMEQILQNLVQNAIKYSPNGGAVAISLTTNATHAMIQVRDSGIGIPEESLPHLFEPYFRAANAERSVMQGMGVGLGIVKELVQLHGGSVSVMSSEGRGSTFTVSLPLENDAVAHQTEAHKTA